MIFFRILYNTPNILLQTEVGCQIVIVFVGGQAFSVTDISGKFWGISLALGIVSIPLGFLIRCIPNPPVERLFCKVGLMRDPPILPTGRPNIDGDVEKSEDNKVMKALGRLRFWSPRNSVAFSRSTTLVGTGVVGSSITPKLLTNREVNAFPTSPTSPTSPIFDGPGSRRISVMENDEKTDLAGLPADNANANG